MEVARLPVTDVLFHCSLFYSMTINAAAAIVCIFLYGCCIVNAWLQFY